jgi:hypothetical protein
MGKPIEGKPVEYPLFTEQFFELHLKDLEIRKHELENKKIQYENGYEYAKNSLRIQFEDIKSLREAERKREKNLLLIFLIVITLFFSMITLSMILNKDDLLIEMAKVVGYIFGGGVTGYGLGLQNGKRKEKEGTN